MDTLSSCEQFGPVSTCLCPKYMKFVFKIWEMIEKIKADVDRLLLVKKYNKKNCTICFVKIQLFSILKPKVVYIYVCFYLFYHFPNFEKEILCTSDINM